MLELLGRFAARHRVDVMAFCLMSNHYHLFIRTREANLARAMQWLNGVYTNRFNRRHGRSGHLLQGRYKAVVVADDSHWHTLSAYVHLNPVRAGMVDDPGKYEWSSFRDYTRSKSRFAWLEPGPVLAAYGSNDAARRRNYRRRVIALSGRPPSFWEDIRDAIFLGTAEQWERLKKDHPPAGREKPVADFSVREQGPVDFESELSRVAEVFGVSADDILAGRRIGHVRPCLYYHLVEHRGLTGSRTAELAGVSDMAVSLGLKTVRHELENDRELRRKIKRLSNKL